MCARGTVHDRRAGARCDVDHVVRGVLKLLRVDGLRADNVCGNGPFGDNDQPRTRVGGSGDPREQ